MPCKVASSYYKYTRRRASAKTCEQSTQRTAEPQPTAAGDSTSTYAPGVSAFLQAPSILRPGRPIHPERQRMAPRLTLVGAHLLLLLVLAVSGDGGAPRLHGSVACLDCAAGHDLSGVVVAVRCAGDGGGGAGLLHAAETDGLGAFDVAMPAAAVSSAAASGGTLCAVRVLGATEQQLCAPRGLAVARVVPAPAPGTSSSSSSHYALGTRLAVFTRCGPASGGGGSGAATTMDDAPDWQERGGDAPRVAAPRRPTPPAMQMPPPVVSAPPRAGGDGSPPFGMGGGLPLIYFFPFIPIIGIP